MTARFDLHLLGPFYIEAGTRLLPKINRKTQAILAYLAVTAVPHTRRTLYDLFCGDANDPAGTLRWHLSRIRRRIDPEILHISRQDVSFNHDITTCDTHHFQQTLSQLDDQSTAAIAQALNAYRGEFLDDLFLRDAPEFELWLLGERTRYRQLYEKGAAELISRYIQETRYLEAIPVAQALLQVNPLPELIHAHMIWLYAQTGQRTAALEQFDQCQALLWQELAVEPSAHLLSLQKAIKNNQPLPSPSAIESTTKTKHRVQSVSDFVGRTAELNQLQKIMRQPEGAAILIDAVAGGGKTRLVQELLSTLPIEGQHLTGACYESTRNIPYHPWQTILAQRVTHQILFQLAPTWQQQLSLLLPSFASVSLPPDPNRQQLFRAVAHVLADAPGITFIEDLQWADEASLSLFHFLAQQIPQTKIRLLGSYRTEEVKENPALQTLIYDLQRTPGTTQITVPPLTAAEIDQLITIMWPELPVGFRIPHMRDSLLQATGGNPLFATEILQELAQAKVLPSDLPIPPSLADLTTRRLNQLPANGRQVIEALAILDQPAHFNLAQQISGRTEDETIAAIDKGLQWRLLQTHEQYQIDFSHDLMRQAVVQQISPMRRQRLHHRAATTLTPLNVEPATLAYHWGLAGDKRKESLFAFLAAKDAAAVYAVEEAIQYYRQALKNPADFSQQMTIMGELGRMFLRVSDWENAQQIFTQGLELAQNNDDLTNQAHFQIALGQLFSRQSHYTDALTHLQAAHEICQQLQNPSLTAKCVGTMGIVYWFIDEYERSLACYQEALAIAEAENDTVNIAIWLSNIAGIYRHNGEYEQALQHYQQASQVHHELGNQEGLAVSLGNLGTVYQLLGDYREAVAHHIEAAQLRYEWGDQAGVATNLRGLGTDYAEYGMDDAARHCFWQALTIDSELGRRDACGISLGEIGRLLARQQQWAPALDALNQAIILLRLTHSRFFLCQCLLQTARIWMKQSEPAQSVPLVDEASSLTAEIQHKQLSLDTQIMALRLQVSLNQLAPVDAVDKLLALTDDAPDTHRAAISYEIWRLDQNQHQHQQEAMRWYQHLYSQLPHYEYRQRFSKLSGEPLPPPPALPAPPTLITPITSDVSVFRQHIKSLLAP